MRVLVYGAGSIGLYVAGRVGQAGHSVALKARGALVESADPTVLSLWRGDHVDHVRDVEVLSALGGDREFDVVLIATKAWQVADAAAEVAAALAPEGRVITIQNGVDAPAVLGARVASERVIAGSLVVVVSRIAPTTVAIAGQEAALTLGPPEARDGAAPDLRVLDLFGGAGIDARWTNDIRPVLWRKLALIAAVGGVGAMSGATVGETRAIPRTAELTEQAMREVIAVANAQGVALGDADLDQILEIYRSGFPADARTSLQRDLAEGRPSELFDLHGSIVDHGARARVPTPVNSTVFASQLPRERAARGDTEELRRDV